MKKFFRSLVISLAMLGLIASTGFADSPNFANANGYGWANDIDAASDTSNHGFGNDYASAKSTGGGGFNVDAFAKNGGWLGNGAAVQGKAVGINDSWACAWDNGLESNSFAKSSVTGTSWALGETLGGWYRNDSIISGNTYFQGTVEQRNGAAETGYRNGQFIKGGNSSFVHFSNGDSFYDNRPFFSVNIEGGFTEGYAVTEGSTNVKIDPYGNTRSISGTTFTKSYVDTNHRGDSRTTYMVGSGGISGKVANSYGAVAGGNASFRYDGTTDAAKGSASLSAKITKTSYSTTVTVNASSSASSLNGYAPQ